MKLDSDCVRAILLSVEATTTYSERFYFDEKDFKAKTYPLLNEFTYDQIIYHIHQCYLSGLFTNAQISDYGHSATVFDLSPMGHEFITNIKDNKVWDGVKSIAAKIGATSLDALIQISSNVIITLIKSHFGLTS